MSPISPIGPNLYRFLKRIGMTQKELAEKTDLTQAAISMICNGKREPSIQSLLKIMKFTHISFKELFK